jgi:hypothetical protein
MMKVLVNGVINICGAECLLHGVFLGGGRDPVSDQPWVILHIVLDLTMTPGRRDVCLDCFMPSCHVYRHVGIVVAK